MREYVLTGALLLFAALPATSNYKLDSFGFGSGGSANTHTTTYSLEGISGEAGGQTGLTTNTGGQPGYVETQQANVPKITLDNNSGQYYNKLHFVIDTQNNPTDATYLIAVSTDNFASNLTYVNPLDGTLTSILSTSDYATYGSWGGSSGSMMIGLTPGTTYYVKVRATQGKFTESPYGPVVNQATASPTLTFSLQTSAGPTPPYSVSIGSLTAGTVNTGAQTINTTMSTNGASGGNVYITGLNGGLFSTSQAHKISSVSNDLSSIGDGFGAQNSSVSQTSGGPYSVVSPYNGSGNNVGIIDSTTRSLYTSGNPVTSGSGVLSLLAKAASTDVAASDYQEVLTFTAAANF